MGEARTIDNIKNIMKIQSKHVGGQQVHLFEINSFLLRKLKLTLKVTTKKFQFYIISTSKSISIFKHLIRVSFSRFKIKPNLFF